MMLTIKLQNYVTNYLMNHIKYFFYKLISNVVAFTKSVKYINS